MGTAEIKSTGLSFDQTNQSSIKRAAQAVENCLKQAGAETQDIELLINTGIYRDDNMCEPAMAAMIQQEAGLNPDPAKYPTRKTAFSFDLMNSACGLLNALQVVDSLMKNDGAGYALIVGGDVHPSMKSFEEFPYVNLGAAMLIEKTDRADKGFRGFQFRTSKDGYCGLEGYTDFSASKTESRHSVIVEAEKDYESRLLEFAIDSAREFVMSHGLAAEKISLVSTHVNRGFGAEIVEALGFRRDTLVSLPVEFGDPHTSALIAGYHLGTEHGFYKDGDQILLLGSGAGLSTACAISCPDIAIRIKMNGTMYNFFEY